MIINSRDQTSRHFEIQEMEFYFVTGILKYLKADKQTNNATFGGYDILSVYRSTNTETILFRIREK